MVGGGGGGIIRVEAHYSSGIRENNESRIELLDRVSLGLLQRDN